MKTEPKLHRSIKAAYIPAPWRGEATDAFAAFYPPVIDATTAWEKYRSDEDPDTPATERLPVAMPERFGVEYGEMVREAENFRSEMEDAERITDRGIAEGMRRARVADEERMIDSRR